MVLKEPHPSELTGAMAGAGFFAQFHAEAWNRLPGVSIAAVADPDRERATAFAARWGIPAVYGDVERMLEGERPSFLDIITRPETHLPLVDLAAARGVHAICQKPMAPSLEECRRIVRRCEEAGVRLIVHENWRWQAWYREIRGLAASDRFGRIYHIGFTLRTGDGRGPEPYPLQPYFRQMPRLLVYETLVHFLDTFRFLVGEIEDLHCTIDRLNPVLCGEDYALILMRFEGGAHGLIDANRIAGPVPAPPALGELRLEGELAALRMTPEGDLWIAEHGQPERLHRYDKPETGYRGDSVLSFQRHAVDCLLSGEAAESEGRSYLRTVELVEACYRSAAAGGARF